MAKAALCEALSLDNSTHITSTTNFASQAASTTTPNFIRAPPVQTSASTYASSADNIARLLQNWTRKSPNSWPSSTLDPETISSEIATSHDPYNSNSFNNNNSYHQVGSASGSPSQGQTPECGGASTGRGGFGSLYNKFMPSINYSSSTDVFMDDAANFTTESKHDKGQFVFHDSDKTKPNVNNNNSLHNHQQVHDQQMPPLTLLEKWLFDDVTIAAAPQDDIMMNMF